MQPELFEDLRAEPQSRGFHPPLFPHRFIRLRIAYEDLIFAALSLILLLLGGFCLGVERGKRLDVHPSVAASQPVEVQAASEQEPVGRVAPPSEMAIPAPSVKAAVLPAESAVVSSSRPGSKSGSGGPYAIQLASYLDAQSARVEADRLRRRGFDPRVVRHGKYFELRLVGYGSRTEAMAPLNRLKKIYHDGFIKRLSEG